MSKASKIMVNEIKEKLRGVCSLKKVFNFALDYLRCARSWNYMVANKTQFTVNNAHQQLVKYKNDRDRLMPYCPKAVEIIDSYFSIEIGEVQERPATKIQKLAGTTLQDIKE